MLQTLSPQNKGLIRRAISQSGVALCPWAIQKNPLFWAKRVRRSCSGQGQVLGATCAQSADLICLHLHPQIAEKVGCPTDDTARMAGCLKVTDPRAVTLAYKMPLAGMECELGQLGGGMGAPCGGGLGFWRRGKRQVSGLVLSPACWHP